MLVVEVHVKGFGKVVDGHGGRDAESALAEVFGVVVKPGGDIVLSGILAVDAPGVVAAMAAQGFEQLAVTEERDWCCIHLRKA